MVVRITPKPRTQASRQSAGVAYLRACSVGAVAVVAVAVARGVVVVVAASTVVSTAQA